MHQRSVIAGANKMQEMFGGFDVGRNGVAQIGIEVGKAGAIYHEIERFRELCAYTFLQTETGLTNIAFYNVYLLAQEFAQARAVLLLQAIERRRVFDDFFEAALRGGGTVAANQQRNFADVRNLLEQVHHPDFADKSGHADQQDVFAGQRATDAEAIDWRSASKGHNGRPVQCDAAAGFLPSVQQLFRLAQYLLLDQCRLLTATLRISGKKPCKRPA